MIKFLLRLLCTLLAIAACAVLMSKAQLTLHALQRKDPLPHAQALFAAERYAEADAWLDFFVTFDYVRANPDTLKLHADIKDKRSKILYQSKKILAGFFTGKSDETSGQVSAVVSDFLIIGDLRDLAIEGWHYVKGEEVDDIAVALAGISVGASVAQAANAAGTAASAGAASPTLATTTAGKGAIVMLKTAKRLGKLPRWLINSLKVSVKSVHNVKRKIELEEMIDDLYTLSTTPGGLELLSHTDDATDLRKMVHFSKTFHQDSHTLYQLAGQSAVDAAQNLTHADEWQALRAASTYGEDGVHALQKMGAKNFAKNLAEYTAKKSNKYKILYEYLPEWLIKFLLLLPTWLLSGIAALGILVWWPYARKLYQRLTR